MTMGTFYFHDNAEWNSTELDQAALLLRRLTHEDIVVLINAAGVKFPSTNAEEVDNETLIGILFSDWDKLSLLNGISDQLSKRNRD
jgi:hypothetical protein